VAVIQDPSTALFPDMPQNAVEQVDCDYVIPLPQVAGVLSKLAVADRVATIVEELMTKTLLDIKCPECGGPLWEERQGRIVEFRCRVGHAYSPGALKEEQREAVERVLWSSVVTLQDAAEVSGKLRNEPNPESSPEGREIREKAEAIKRMLPRV
jgi:two-component system chemotaxis response regulator CheB